MRKDNKAVTIVYLFSLEKARLCFRLSRIRCFVFILLFFCLHHFILVTLDIFFFWEKAGPRPWCPHSQHPLPTIMTFNDGHAIINLPPPNREQFLDGVEEWWIRQQDHHHHFLVGFIPFPHMVLMLKMYIVPNHSKEWHDNPKSNKIDLLPQS